MTRTKWNAWLIVLNWLYIKIANATTIGNAQLIELEKIILVLSDSLPIILNDKCT